MNDQTLSEIVEACKGGERPEYDQLRYAICCMDSLITFDRLDLSRAVGNPHFYTPEFLHSQSFERHKRAGSRTPLQWLGADNNPDDPRVQKRRDSSKRIVEHIIKNENSDKPS